MEVAGLVLTIWPVAVTLTKALNEAYNTYDCVGERYDQILTLDAEKHKFLGWVEGRRFTSKRAWEYRMRTDPAAAERDIILACQTITRIIYLVAEIATILDQESQASQKPAKGSRSRPKFFQAIRSKNVSEVTILEAISPGISRPPSAQSLRPSITPSSPHERQALAWQTPRTSERVQLLLQNLQNVHTKIPVSVDDRLGSEDSLLMLSTSPNAPEHKLSRSRRAKDALLQLAFKTSSTKKLEELLKKVRRFNKILDPLLSDLRIDSLKPPVEHGHHIRFEPPFRRNQGFLGRDDIMREVGAHLDFEGHRKGIVLYGLGGHGKTQIALEYAFQFHQFYTAVIWIDATTKTTIRISTERFIERIVEELLRRHQSFDDMVFGKIAATLNLSFDASQKTINKDTILDAVRTSQYPHDILANWLAQDNNDSWLMIVDNFDNPEETGEEVNRLLPNNDVGQILTTTRAITPRELDLKAELKSIEVGGFKVNDKEDQSLLVKFTTGVQLHHMHQAELKAAKSIEKDLSHSPLHLLMASAYITVSNSQKFNPTDTPGAQRGAPTPKLFRSYRDELASRVKSDPSSKPKKESCVLKMSLEKLSTAAKRLLGILVVLSPGIEIPQKLLDRWLEKAGKVDWLGDSNLEAILVELSSYRFLNLTRQQDEENLYHTYNMHAKVHEWTWQYLHGDGNTEHVPYLKEGLHVLASGFILDNQARTGKEWKYEREIQPHLDYVYQSIEKQYQCPTVDCEGTLKLDNTRTLALAKPEELSAFAKVYYIVGDYQKARALYEWTLEKLGDNDTSTIALQSMDCLGVTFEKLGEHEQAYRWASKAFDTANRMNGMEDSFTLHTSHNLAIVLASMGNYKGALDRYNKLLALPVHKRPFDNAETDCPIATLKLMKDCASVHNQLHNFDQALGILQKIENKWNATRTDTADDGHPLILEVRTTIACTQSEKGEYREALKAYDKLLQDKKLIFGPQHYRVMGAIIDRGYAELNCGDLQAAMDSFTEAASGYKLIFGNDDHPALLHAKESIARVWENQGQFRMALELYTNVMNLSAKTRPGQRGEYRAMTTVGNMLYRMGRYKEALGCYDDAHKGYREAFGDDHQFTQYSAYGIAQIKREQGHYDEALAIFQDCLVFEKKLTPGEASMFTVMREIATTLERQGKYEESENQFDIVIDGNTKISSEKDSGTISAYQCKARVQESKKQYKEALATLKLVMTARKEVPGGAEHPMIYHAMCSQARVKTKLKPDAEVMNDLQICIETWKRQLDEDHPWILEAQHCVGLYYAAIGKHRDALSTFEEVYENRVKKLNKEHPDSSETKAEMAVAEFRLQNYENASRLIEEAVEELTGSLGPGHPKTEDAEILKTQISKISNKVAKRRGLPKIKLFRSD